MNELYCDGGVIGHNPSKIGGTWAFHIVYGEFSKEAGVSGVITPEQAGLPAITNNLTEMLALLKGIECLPADWQGTIYSDSMITLGRAFEGWKWNGIPLWMHKIYQEQTKRLIHWSEIKHVLLQGHPTQAELLSGVGNKGYPVSIHNKWCDQACNQRAKEFMQSYVQAEAIHG